MTLLAITVLFAAAVLFVYGEVTYRRDMACVPVPTVVDPQRSASSGGFGPEWDVLIAWSDAWWVKEAGDVRD